MPSTPMSSTLREFTDGSLFIEGYPDEKSVKAELRKLNIFTPQMRRDGDYLEVSIKVNRLFNREQLVRVVKGISQIPQTERCLYARSDSLDMRQFVIFCPKVSQELASLFYELWLSRKIQQIKKHGESPLTVFIE